MVQIHNVKPIPIAACFATRLAFDAGSHSAGKFVSDCSAAAALKFSNWLKKCANFGGLFNLVPIAMPVCGLGRHWGKPNLETRACILCRDCVKTVAPWVNKQR